MNTWACCIWRVGSRGSNTPRRAGFIDTPFNAITLSCVMEYLNRMREVVPGLDRCGCAVLNCPKPRVSDAPEVTQSAHCALKFTNDDLDHFEARADLTEQRHLDAPHPAPDPILAFGQDDQQSRCPFEFR